jgi:hypothetical protein
MKKPRGPHPLQRLLLDVEALAIRFETLRLELVTVVWSLRQQAQAATLAPRPRPAGRKKRARR